VRPARAADRDALHLLWDEAEALHARLQPRFFRVEKKSGEQLERTIRLTRILAARDEALLVAVDDEKAVCGLLHVQLYDTPPSALMVPARRGHLEDLVVAKKYRRRGCGRALMEAGAAWARARGATELLLTVWAGNARAERFYKKLGYRRLSQVLGTAL
jgi:ribosomal protein S18 acetylase RimI-like enzyme